MKLMHTHTHTHTHTHSHSGLQAPSSSWKLLACVSSTCFMTSGDYSSPPPISGTSWSWLWEAWWQQDSIIPYRPLKISVFWYLWCRCVSCVSVCLSVCLSAPFTFPFLVPAFLLLSIFPSSLFSFSSPSRFLSFFLSLFPFLSPPPPPPPTFFPSPFAFLASSVSFQQ